MSIHPLTPRKPRGIANVSGVICGAVVGVLSLLIFFQAYPPVAWMHHVDAPRTADLQFMWSLIYEVWSREAGQNVPIVTLLRLPTVFQAVITAVIYLDIQASVTVRLAATVIAGILTGSEIQGRVLASQVAQPAVTHIRGQRLVSGGAAVGGLAARWHQRFLSSAAGVALADRLVMPRALETEHILLTGGTGAGKTTILELLMDGALKKGDRILALDVKGDVTARLPTDNFQLLALDDPRSSRWVLGLDILTGNDAAELAAELIPETSDPSWSSGARQVLAALVEHLQRAQARQSDKIWSWADLDRLLQTSVGDLFDILKHDNPVAASLIDVSQDETRKQAMSFYLVLIAATGQLVRACADLGKGSGKPVSVRQWVAKDHSVLIVRQSQRQPELSAAMSRIVLKIIADNVASQTHKAARLPTWLFLDELPQLGACAAVTRLAAIGRSSNVRIVPAIQSPAQLRELYGAEGAQHLLDNMNTKIVGRIASGNTAAEIATKWIGYRTVSWWETVGYDPNGRPRAEQKTKDVPVVDPEFLTDGLGLHTTIWGKPAVQALVIGHGDVAILAWPVGRWGERRPATVARVDELSAAHVGRSSSEA